MTADEMFKILGYTGRETFFGDISYESARRRIIFELDSKNIDTKLECSNCHYSIPLDMTPQEIQAIHKKCEELGWLDE